MDTSLVILYSFLFILLIVYRFGTKRRKNDYKDKKVLILGGSSGLGLSIAKILKLKGAKVCIAARNLENLKKQSVEFDIMTIDVVNESEFEKIDNFDYIFSCVGTSIPKFLIDQDDKETREMIETNLISNINLLKRITKLQNKPDSVVMVASSLALYTFPGYSVYSCSKTALKMIFESQKLEMKTIGVNLKMFFVSTIYTPGFLRENKTKPAITAKFESSSLGNSCEPDYRAKTLIDKMEYRDRIHSDNITYLMMINEECELPIDFMLLPIACVFNQIFKIYRNFYFRKFKI